MPTAMLSRRGSIMTNALPMSLALRTRLSTTRFNVFSCVAAAWLLACGFSPVMAQAPTISFVSPSGGQRGSSVDVTINGSALAGACALWTDLPVSATAPQDIANNGKEAGKVVVRVQIPPDAPAGIGGIRVVTPKGISNVRLFMIDDLQNVPKNGSNKSPAQAQRLELPCVVSG